METECKFLIETITALCVWTTSGVDVSREYSTVSVRGYNVVCFFIEDIGYLSMRTERRPPRQVSDPPRSR